MELLQLASTTHPIDTLRVRTVVTAEMLLDILLVSAQEYAIAVDTGVHSQPLQKS